MLTIFSCASMSTLGKCLFRSSTLFLIGLFVSLILSYMNYLFSLEINPLSVILIANVYVCAQSLMRIVCDPMDCKLPGSSVPGILLARILK